MQYAKRIDCYLKNALCYSSEELASMSEAEKEEMVINDGRGSLLKIWKEEAQLATV